MTGFAELDLIARTEQLEAAVREIRKIGDAGERTEHQVKRSTDTMAAGFGRLRSLIVPAAAALGAMFGGVAIARGSQEIQKITNGFLGMGQSAQEAARSLDRVAAIADMTRAPLGATAELYRRVSVAAGELGASQDDIQAFTQNVGFALAASGTSAQEASGALLQLSQAMAGGVVRAEEFNSILEGAFPIAQAAARGIDEAGGSVGRLRQLVVDGQISSEEFFNAVLSQSDALQQAFESTAPTVSQAMTDLSNSVALGSASMDSALGISNALAQGLLGLSNGVQWLGENFDLMAGGVSALGLAVAVSYTPAVIAAVGATWAWVGGLTALKTALIKTGVGALVVGLGVATAYMIRIREATGSWGEAFSLVSSIVREAFDRIVMRADALNNRLNAVSADARAAFLGMAAGVVEGVQSAVQAVDSGVTSLVNTSIQGIAGLINVAIEGLNSVIELANKIPGVDVQAIGSFEPELIGSALGGAGRALGGIADSLRSEQGLARQAAIDMRAYADILGELSGGPMESVNALREAMAAMSDETVNTKEIVDQLNNALLNPTGGAGAGGGAGGAGEGGGFTSRLDALTQQFQSERELIDQWYMEAQEILADRRALEILGEEEHRAALLQVEELYQQQLAALRGQAFDKQLGEAADFFGALASVTAQGGERLNKVTRVLGATQAFINTLVAQSQVLADPSLGFFGKLAAYIKIGATGFGIVSALKSGGNSASAAVGGGGSRSATPEPARRDRFVRIDVQGDGMFADMLRNSVGEIADALFDESRTGGNVVVVGR